MRILMISAEYAPFAKAGGLADMVTGLSGTLAAAGHDVRVVMPCYPGLDAAPTDPAADSDIILGHTEVSPVALAGAHPGYTLRQILQPPGAGPVLYRIHAPDFFGGPTIYGGGELEARRFALLAHGALRLCTLIDWSPDILHCHDWHAALAPVLIRTGYRAERALREASSVLTIHNIGYQGAFPALLAPDLGLLPGAIGTGPPAELNFLREGILAADALTTVSPTHAAEILTPEYGKGLDAILRHRRNRLAGILNGVDYSAWDPATDRRIPARYDAAHPGAKARCREALLARAGLDRAPGAPLLGMVTRLAQQKGIELVLEALPPLLRRHAVQTVILGQGDAGYVALLRQMTADFPGQFQFFDVQDESLARLIFAGSDAFLVPSIYEPCGLTQMYALRYGAVPVVRETGGLKDTVRHFDVTARTGTGSVFKHADSSGLAWAIDEILAWFAQPDLWAAIRQNGMREDFSWRHQAPLYEALYRRLTGAALP